MSAAKAVLCLCAMIFIAFVRPVSAAGGIEYVTVQAEGSGQSVGHATASALSAAVTQVNGAALASSTVSAEVRAALDTEKGSSFASASATAEAVAQQTKGTVRDYRIVSKAQDGSLWNVVVEARIAKYARSAQTDRLRMSIIPFRTRTQMQGAARDQFINELSNHLTQSRKFAMLDRQFEAERQSEMQINASDSVPVEEMAKLGNRLGTDYMIVGVVEDATTATRSTEIAGRVLNSSSSRFAVSYRVIDAPTGQVKFSDSWSRSAEGGSTSGLAALAANEVARQIVEAIFPLAVESVDGNLVFLGQGGKSIKVGQKYRLLRQGKLIKDSHTGESLGREESDVGMIEIVDVQSKIAKGRILKSSADITKNFEPGAYVVRLHSEAPRATSSSGTGAAVASDKKHASRAESMQKKAENDW